MGLVLKDVLVEGTIVWATNFELHYCDYTQTEVPICWKMGQELYHAKFEQKWRHYSEMLFCKTCNCREISISVSSIGVCSRRYFLFFFDKHKFYEYKVEVSVPPTGVAFICTIQYPCSVIDLDIMQKNENFQKTKLHKLLSGSLIK